MAVINRKYKYLFLAEPRTGSRSVSIALRQHEGYESIGSHHATWQYLIKKNYLTFKELDKLTVFSVRRHPADVIISDWLNTDDKTLQECITARALRETFYWHNHLGYILKYEDGLEKCLNLSFRFNKVFNTPLPLVKLPWKGKTKEKKDWRSYYTEQEIEFMRQHFSHLGYTL